MIYIVTAMGIEGRAIIKYFNLKRDNSIKKFQVFKNEYITLILTGVGSIKVAVAISYFFSNLDIKKDDFLINIGIAGLSGEGDLGDIFIINKIKNNDSGRYFYPDMIFNHKFKEGYLESFSKVVDKNEDIDGDIVDMEGAGFFEAGGYFFKSYQMILLKIISDRLSLRVEKDGIERLLDQKIGEIIDWIIRLKDINMEKKITFDLKESEILELFLDKFRYTESMKNRLQDILLYRKIKGIDIVCELERYLKIEEGGKKKGKEILDEFEREYFE